MTMLLCATATYLLLPSLPLAMYGDAWSVTCWLLGVMLVAFTKVRMAYPMSEYLGIWTAGPWQSLHKLQQYSKKCCRIHKNASKNAGGWNFGIHLFHMIFNGLSRATFLNWFFVWSLKLTANIFYPRTKTHSLAIAIWHYYTSHVVAGILVPWARLSPAAGPQPMILIENVCQICEVKH